MCGEHVRKDFFTVRVEGSSPHVRGTLQPLQSTRIAGGIIPACAGNTSSAPKVPRRSWDHPRMCGEHALEPVDMAGFTGSSPHVRGTRVMKILLQLNIGIIPACAGNTSGSSCFMISPWDHPRMCGEHISPPMRLASTTGSSPHVRGTPASGSPSCAPTGIIPACAGNTASWPSWPWCRGDHPRMCGEHLPFHLFGVFAPGSSPHVRGTLPANRRPTDYRWDHPRMCGEHPLRHRRSLQLLGSSPHVRGTLQRAAGTVQFVGIIPACAGNTMHCRRIRLGDGDHPRMCGEHSTSVICVDEFAGSSPHVRGTHSSITCSRIACRGSSPHVRGTRSMATPVVQTIGIIPACAGNTNTNTRTTSSPKDHPRMCGEHWRCRRFLVRRWGSSPHVRGTLSGDIEEVGERGIIPACAGNTLRN